MARIRVLVVDDHRIFAESLAAALAAEPDVDVAAAGSGPAALRCLERAASEGRAYDVILVDAELGTLRPAGRPAPVPAPGDSGPVDGISLVAGIRSLARPVRAVVLAEKDDPRRAALALQAGACGWVAKDSSLQRLLAVIRGVLREETHLPPALLTGVLRELMADRRHRTESEQLVESLTPREREVLRCMVAETWAARRWRSGSSSPRTRCVPTCRTCWGSWGCTRRWRRSRWPGGRVSTPQTWRRRSWCRASRGSRRGGPWPRGR